MRPPSSPTRWRPRSARRRRRSRRGSRLRSTPLSPSRRSRSDRAGALRARALAAVAGAIEAERRERLLPGGDDRDRLVDGGDPEQLAEVSLRAGDPHRARLASEVAGAVEEGREPRRVDELTLGEGDEQGI